MGDKRALVHGRPDILRPETKAMVDRLLAGETIAAKEDPRSIAAARNYLKKRGHTVTVWRDQASNGFMTKLGMRAKADGAPRKTAARGVTAEIRQRFLRDERVSNADVVELGGSSGLLAKAMNQMRKEGYVFESEEEIAPEGGKARVQHFLKRRGGRPRKAQVEAKAMALRSTDLPDQVAHTNGNGHVPLADLNGAIGLLGYTVRGLLLDDDGAVQLVVKAGGESYVAELRGHIGGP